MRRIKKKPGSTLARPQLAVIAHCISNGFIAEVHWVTVAEKKTSMKLWEGALPVVHHSGSLASKDRTQKKALMSGQNRKEVLEKTGFALAI